MFSYLQNVFSYHHRPPLPPLPPRAHRCGTTLRCPLATLPHPEREHINKRRRREHIDNDAHPSHQWRCTCDCSRPREARHSATASSSSRLSSTLCCALWPTAAVLPIAAVLPTAAILPPSAKDMVETRVATPCWCVCVREREQGREF